MGKYIKSNSVFTLRKKIQNLEDGSTILERDWTTLGERRRFGKGKTPIYSDGNFIFTRNNMRFPSRRSKPSSESVELKYEDVKDAKSSVNNVELNTNTNDIRSFAYYGSCVDLVNTSISNIIMNFPGCIAVTERTLSYAVYNEGEDTINRYENFREHGDGKVLHVVDNPFNIDILSKEAIIGEYDNIYRYMCESYEQYEIIRYEKIDGKLKEINRCNIIGYDVDYQFDECGCNNRDQWYNYGNCAFYDGKRLTYKELHDGSYSCHCLDKTIEKTADVKGDDAYKTIEQRYSPIVVTFRTDCGTDLIFYGFRSDKDFIFLSTETNVVIKPNEEVIENYFNNLKGFEKQLLTRNSNPLYKNVFITPIEMDETYVYAQRSYVWPSIYGYCIKISDSEFETFFNNLLQMATIYDEATTNNLYGRMTHEAIKNFDWSYTKDYVDGDETENIEGGEQMQKIIHFIGRVFDEGKQYIDGIKTCNKVTYDSFTNTPDALLSDTLEMHGWDVTSVVPLMENNSENKGIIELDLDSLKTATQNDKIRWFDTANIEALNTSNFDVKFMRRLLLSSKRIFQTKGTQESIDMIMGMFGFGRKFNEAHEQDDNGDYKITEQWFEVTPKKYDEEITKKDGETITLGEWFASKNNSRSSNYDSDKEDEFVNLPINTVKVDNVKYIIPFYDKNKNYEDLYYNFYFQSKGGWGHKVEDQENIEEVVGDNFKKFEEYKETISYLKVLSTADDLLNVRTIETSLNDIYYVIDLSNAANIFGTGVDYSHFFYVKQYGSTIYPETWGNIDLNSDDNLLDNNMLQLKKKALYLDSIINTSFGNNPHSGFGYYDDGATFYEYLSNPFKGFIEAKRLDLLTDEEEKYLLFEGFDTPQMEHYEYEDGTRSVCKRKLYNEITDDLTDYKVKINSKVVCLENCLKSQDGDSVGLELYKEYFHRAILPYIMQVIPSTTILLLKNF